MPSGPPPRGPQEGLGIAVRILRERVGLSRSELAERAEVSTSWLGRIERGDHDPSWGSMRRIARGLGVPLEVLSEVAEENEGR